MAAQPTEEQLAVELAKPWAASVTFSKSTESHVGAAIHGVRASEGYTREELMTAHERVITAGYDAEIIHLHEACGTQREAYVLCIRGACSLLAAEVDLDALQVEYQRIVWPELDRHLVTYGKVASKHARGNAELGPTDVRSNYCDFAPGEKIAGRVVSGRVIAFHRVPRHAAVAKGWAKLLGPKAADLLAEVNHYGPSFPHGGIADNARNHTFARTGIGFHGDSERPDVACLCMGNQDKELHFQAFEGKDCVGQRCILLLRPGDAYVMCEVACGFRWKTELRKTSVVHYRHGAGAPGSTQWTPTVDMLRVAAAKKRAAKRKREAEDSQERR